jgi:hypothetical protein
LNREPIHLRLPNQKENRLALLTQQQWMIVIGCSLLTALPGFLFNEISPWIAGGFALVGVATAHLILTCRHTLPLPQAAVLIALLYYLIAPIVAIYYPAENPLYRLRDSETYFAYAVPCLWATAFGWSVSFFGARPLKLRFSTNAGDATMLRGLDLLIFFGLLLSFVSGRIELTSTLGTVVLLLANMRYVGLFGWVLAGASGWQARVLLVLLVEFVRSVSTGFFLNFLLWSLSASVVIMFRQRFSMQRILLVFAFAGMFLPCFQFAKWELRKSTWGTPSGEQQMILFDTVYTINTFSKTPLMIGKVLESSINLVFGNYTDEFIAETTVRYNQGWIVSRIQNHVPDVENYANGETVNAAVIASIFPRFLMPDKLSSGGGETFTRFTGVKLNSDTSMNLGFIGEMYANFGYYYGILGCGIYALFFGLIYNRLVTASRKNAMILCFIPYILNFAVASEVGLVDVLNFTVKSSIVAAAIYFATPIVFAKINKMSVSSMDREFRH